VLATLVPIKFGSLIIRALLVRKSKYSKKLEILQNNWSISKKLEIFEKNSNILEILQF
jgi:hypothetical protein